MDTIPFMIPSTSLSVASLKLASQTPIIYEDHLQDPSHFSPLIFLPRET